jgi:hypothetical protein
VPGVPEIRLHKAGPASGLSRLADSEPDFATPYWAYHWGGGLALARYVLDDFKSMDPAHPEPPPAYLKESPGPVAPRRAK